MVIFWNILDLSSPRQASGSPRPWESFSLKQPTRLSELIPSSLSNWLAWTSFPCRGRVLGVGKPKKGGRNKTLASGEKNLPGSVNVEKLKMLLIWRIWLHLR